MSVKLRYILFLAVSIAAKLSEAVGPNEGEVSSSEALPSFIHHISNYLIYSLSTDVERQDGQTYESWLTLVINNILHRSGIYCIKLNSRLLGCFKKKINSLLLAYKRAQKSGGRQTTKLLNTWMDSTYTVTVHYHETDLGGLQKENIALKGEKRLLEDALDAESSKRCKVEQELNVLKKTMHKTELSYKGKFKQLVKKIAKLTSGKKTRGPDKKKSFVDYSKAHQARVRKQIKEQCQTVLAFLGQYEFAPSRIELYNSASGQVESFSFTEDEDASAEEREVNEEEVKDLNMWLYLKDKFHISNEAWHELAMKSEESPNLSKLIKHIKNINKKWNIKDTPGNVEGVQIGFQESLLENIQRLEKAGLLKNGQTIKIKVSGDGTNIGRHLSVINITYTILNETKLAMSEKGNYLLAVIRSKESYEVLSESLKDLIQEMEQLKEITCNENTYPLEYFLGGDWKFLACVCGIGGANADYACIWCTCPKLKRHDADKVWSLLDPEHGARNLEDIKKYSKSRKFNCNHAPLFSFIPLSHVVIDTLHLYLRICDNLIELLIRELRMCDAIDKKTKFNDNLCREKYTHIAKYEKCLQDIGINFHFYVSKETKQLEYRDLTGPEKVKLFENIDIPSLLPDSTKSTVIQEIWHDYSTIISHLKHDVKFDEVNKIKSEITSWMKKFLTLNQTKDATPYMHALCKHVPEFLSLYGNIEIFTQQGMEKYNDITSKNYFRSTNHQGILAIKQLFLKRKRVQYLEAASCARVKRDYTCSNCQGAGHTIKTCTSQCRNSKHATYCAHLRKINGKYQPICKT